MLQAPRLLPAPTAGPSARGQAAVEWTGAVLVAGLVVLAALAAAPGLGGALAATASRAACALASAGAPCGEATSARRADRSSRPVSLTRPGTPAPRARTPRARQLGGSGSAPPDPEPASVLLGEDAARDAFAFGDPARCRRAADSAAARLCLGEDGRLRSCRSAAPAVADGVLCASALDTRALEAETRCGPAPAARAAGRLDAGALCRITAQDGSTAMLRCSAGEPAGLTEGPPGGETRLRRCTDTGRDPAAARFAAVGSVRCLGDDGADRAVDGPDGPAWQREALCADPRGAAYVCRFLSARRDDDLVGAYPLRPTACDSRTVPERLVRGCAPTATPRLVRCRARDGAQLDCLRLDGTLQHCARPPRCRSADRANPGRTLHGASSSEGSWLAPVDRDAASAEVSAVLAEALARDPAMASTLASCPRSASAGGAGPAGAATPGGPFEQFAQLVGPDGAPLATLIDGQLISSAPLAEHAALFETLATALSELQAVLGPRSRPATLQLDQADPYAPLTVGAEGWRIGSERADSPAAYAFAPRLDALHRRYWWLPAERLAAVAMVEAMHDASAGRAGFQRWLVDERPFEPGSSAYGIGLAVDHLEAHLGADGLASGEFAALQDGLAREFDRAPALPEGDDPPAIFALLSRVVDAVASLRERPGMADALEDALEEMELDFAEARSSQGSSPGGRDDELRR